MPLSDELCRRAKAAAALRRRKPKDLDEEGLRCVLAAPGIEKAEAPTPTSSLHDLMQDCCGIAAHAPADYATNPKHMEGFVR